jgi:hypothetical protein
MKNFEEFVKKISSFEEGAEIFKKLSSEDRINIVLTATINRIAWRRLLTADELADYREKKAAKREKERIQQQKALDKEYQVQINKRIDFYNDMLGKKDAVIKVVEKWGGKMVNKNFKNELCAIFQPVYYRGYYRAYTIDFSAVDTDIKPIVSMSVWYGDSVVHFISATKKPFVLNGKTYRLNAPNVIESINNNMDQIVFKVKTLKDYKDKIKGVVNEWNGHIARLNELREEMPHDFKDVYKKELEKIYL